MTLAALANSILTAAEAAGLPVTRGTDFAGTITRADGLHIGLVVSGDYDISVYYGFSDRLGLLRFTNPDAAASHIANLLAA
jgi:hypothetical protein